jgi:hypothetical protein
LERPFPLATVHPDWDAWVARSLSADLAPYGTHLELYHYTSGAAANNILSLAELWATSARLNDEAELDYGLRPCLDALLLIRDRRFLWYVGALANGLQQRFRHDTFITCFSRSGTLPCQWRRYADLARGFCLAFDMMCLSALWRDPALRLMPVEYGRDAQTRRAERAVASALEDIAACQSTSVTVAHDVHARFTLLATELMFLCSSFKDESWEAEQEWRLIYLCEAGAPDAGIALRPDGRAFVRISLTRTLDHLPRHTYCGIRQGPRSDPSAAESLRNVLRAHDEYAYWEIQAPCE